MARTMISNTHFRGQKRPPFNYRQMIDRSGSLGRVKRRKSRSKKNTPVLANAQLLEIFEKGQVRARMKSRMMLQSPSASAVPFLLENEDAGTLALIEPVEIPVKAKPRKRQKAGAKKSVKTKTAAPKKTKAKKQTFKKAAKKAQNPDIKPKNDLGISAISSAAFKDDANDMPPWELDSAEAEMQAALQRNQSLQVYRKNGWFASMGYWLRQNVRSIFNARRNIRPAEQRKNPKRLKPQQMVVELNRLAMENKELRRKLAELSG